MSERFAMHKWRKDATTPFNHFRIIDEKELRKLLGLIDDE